MRKIYIDNSTFMEQKEIMKQVWNDIFNNEHCTCRDFEDYWNWKISEKEISKELKTKKHLKKQPLRYNYWLRCDKCDSFKAVI